jgi:hypothetical protein
LEASRAAPICGMLAGPNAVYCHDQHPMSASRYLDRIAITLSTICIVHCLAMPVLVAALPVLAITLGTDGHFHALMLWLVVPTSALGFSLGYKVHGNAGRVAAGTAAVLVLAVVALWGHDHWNRTVEIGVNVVASLLLASAHWRNFREVRRRHQHT